MNDPSDLPINVEDMIFWVTAYKARTGKSWPQISRVSNIPPSTIQLFGTGKYTGDLDAVARRMFAFRQKVESQEQRTSSVLSRPDYVETITSRRITILLEMAQVGRITVAAMGSGMCKTMAAEHFQKCMGESVFLVTLRPTAGGVSSMMHQVMRAMRILPRANRRAMLSEQIMDHVQGGQSTIIIDEANNLDLEAIDEIRGWHDVTGVGIGLLGNEELARRIRGERISHQYARIASRISKMWVQDLLLDEDITAVLDAMGIEDPRVRALLVKVGTSPGHGGLREVRQILESAHIDAIGEDKPLEYEHVLAASGSRVTQILRRAA